MTLLAVPFLNPPMQVPGSFDINNSQVTNKDFSDKLEGMNVVTYAFLEAQAKIYNNPSNGQPIPNPDYSKIGTLYFNDPWADLSPNDSFCKNNASICYFAINMQNKDPASSSKMGNFGRFTVAFVIATLLKTC